MTTTITARDKQAYRVHKAGAKRRVIDFNLTFEEWWSWWQETGHYLERGVGKGKYVMARYGDAGPYELGNIFCCTQEQNVSMAQTGKPKPCSEEMKAHLSNIKKGIPKSEETRKRMSEAAKGRPKSEQHRAKLSEANKGKTIANEVKQRISKSLKGRPKSPEHSAKIKAAAQAREERKRQARIEAEKSA